MIVALREAKEIYDPPFYKIFFGNKPGLSHDRVFTFECSNLDLENIPFYFNDIYEKIKEKEKRSYVLDIIKFVLDELEDNLKKENQSILKFHLYKSPNKLIVNLQNYVNDVEKTKQSLKKRLLKDKNSFLTIVDNLNGKVNIEVNEIEKIFYLDLEISFIKVRKTIYGG